jgi:ribosomal protein S18 acetylase RimI-like enzyme
MEIKTVTSEDDISKTWEVMQLLRPHLKQGEYVDLISEMLSSGYNMAFVEENDKAVSVIGFRHVLFLFYGRHIYIDDLSTLNDYRGKGYAGRLLDHVCTLAKEKGYQHVTLDSGCSRYTAHRLYMNKGFIIGAHHFSKEI